MYIHKMTENDSEVDKYIKCSRCKMKYNNTDEDIQTNFGFNRLNERLKTCVTCRGKAKKHRDNHPEQITQANQRYRDNHPEQVKETKQKYHDSNRETINVKKNIQVECELCGASICKSVLRRHQQGTACKKQ